MSWKDRLGDSHHKDKQDEYLMKITFYCGLLFICTVGQKSI